MADLSRILEALAGPLGLIWIGHLAACAICAYRRRWIVTILCGLTAGILFLFGSTELPARILASIERPYVNPPLSQVPSSDVIIVLGGMVNPSSHSLIGADFRTETDRALTGFRLAQEGKAHCLVFGGGDQLQEWSESQFMTNWLSRSNTGAAKLIALPIAVNTYDEARLFKALADEHRWKSVILVTSAYHLKRAQAVFEHFGISVFPVGSDFAGLARLEEKSGFNPVPRPQGFVYLRLYMHEMIGRLIYHLRGWTSPMKKDA